MLPLMLATALTLAASNTDAARIVTQAAPPHGENESLAIIVDGVVVIPPVPATEGIEFHFAPPPSQVESLSVLVDGKVVIATGISVIARRPFPIRTPRISPRRT